MSVEAAREIVATHRPAAERPAAGELRPAPEDPGDRPPRPAAGGINVVAREPGAIDETGLRPPTP